MTNRFTFSAILIAIVATTTSAAFAASRTIHHGSLTAFASVPPQQDNGRESAPLPTRQPVSGSERFQDNGIAEAMGYPYRAR